MSTTSLGGRSFAAPGSPLPGSVQVIAIGRPTFDLEWARIRVARSIELLRTAGVHADVDPTPLTEPTAIREVVAGWTSPPARVIVLQASFTDSRFVTELAAATDAEVAVWAYPEQRGGRLRSNSLCGLILGAHALASADRPLSWRYLDPHADDAAATVRAWLAERPRARPPLGDAAAPAEPRDVRRRAHAVVERLRAAHVGVVGDPPPGFEPCHYHERARVIGIETESIDIAELIEWARRIPAAGSPRALPHLDALDREAVQNAGRFQLALRATADARGWDGVAVRCWPEPFDELGCAACAALAHLNEDGVPAGCEADVLGTATMLTLGWLGDSHPFLADLVDIDRDGDTAAVWHCGVAPADLASPGTLRAGRHPNRGVPLVQQLALRPGVATVARFSQSRGAFRLVLGRVEVLDAPCPYDGSGGVVRFGRPAGEVLTTIVDEGLEHHLALVYGDVTAELREVAAELEIPVVEL